jgi:hypothetical protein
VWPPRASVTAVANPIPLLVPVTNAMVINISQIAEAYLFPDAPDYLVMRPELPQHPLPARLRHRPQQAVLPYARRR